MKFLVSAAAIAAAFALVGVTGASAASSKGSTKPNVEVIKRDASGRAEVVRVDGKDYLVCSKSVTDGCINPREAGLNWGNTPINYWPGRPASQIARKLPVNGPA